MQHLSKGYMGFKTQFDFLDNSFKQLSDELSSKDEEIAYLKMKLEEKDELIKKLSTGKPNDESTKGLNESDDGIELINKKKK